MSIYNIEASSIIVFILITVFSMLKIKNKISFAKKLLSTKLSKIGFILLISYCSFALVGQKVFIYPFASPITSLGIFIYIIAEIWFIPVVISILYMLNNTKLFIDNTSPRISTTKFCLIITSIILIPLLFTLWAFNPGICSQDTYETLLLGAHNIHGAIDWHPAFYQLCLHFIIRIWDSPYAVEMVQYTFWIFVLLEAFLYLRKKHVSDRVLIITALFIGLNAANCLHITSIWKDIPYTICLLWMTLILAKLSIDFDYYKTKWIIYLELIISSVGVYLFRKNGVATFAVVAIFMIILLKRNVKMWCSLAIIILCIMAYKGPIYSYYDFYSMGKMGMYCGLGQDILGVYYTNKNVSDDTLELVDMMTEGQIDEYNYVSNHSTVSYYVDVPVQRFIKDYMDTFFKNPIIMSRAIIARADTIWNIFPGENTDVIVVNSYPTPEWDFPDWLNYYPARKYGPMYTAITFLTGLSEDIQFINILIWRAGISTLLGILLLGHLLYKRTSVRELLFLAPFFGQILGLVASNGFADFRFFWPINVLLPVIILLGVLVSQASSQSFEEDNTSKQRNA